MLSGAYSRCLKQDIKTKHCLVISIKSLLGGEAQGSTCGQLSSAELKCETAGYCQVTAKL